MDLAVMGHLKKASLLSIDKTQYYIYRNSPSLEELMSNLPAVKEDTILNKNLVMGKNKEKGRSFDRSKFWMELICDACNTQQFVYSNKMVVAKGGAKKSDMK